ncbi:MULTISPECIES: CRISPR-associated endoribonuclease Cas6 [Chitinophagaceae]
MRLYIKLSKNKDVIPFNYQHLLTGTIHKWIGINNKEHGSRSLFSFSWLQNVSVSKIGINLNQNSYFFISAYDEALIKTIVKGILNEPEAFCGCRVVDVQVKTVPTFSEEEYFIVNSPILIRKREGNRVKHVTYEDNDFDIILTESLKSKLRYAGLPDDNITVVWDKNYANPQIKLIDYKGIKNKATLAPVIIKGSPEQIAFAWEVGLGNSTGIGFGAIK